MHTCSMTTCKEIFWGELEKNNFKSEPISCLTSSQRTTKEPVVQVAAVISCTGQKVTPNRKTYRWTDGWTNERMDRLMEGRWQRPNLSPCCGHCKWLWGFRLVEHLKANQDKNTNWYVHEIYDNVWFTKVHHRIQKKKSFQHHQLNTSFPSSTPEEHSGASQMQAHAHTKSKKWVWRYWLYQCYFKGLFERKNVLESDHQVIKIAASIPPCWQFY